MHGILYARLDIGYYGLIHGLPVTFFIALALLTVASVILWFAPERHNKLLCLQLLILIGALWLIPLITGGSPPFTDHAYRNLGVIDYIIRNGHFNAAVSEYQSWPGAFFISAMVTELSAIDLELLLNIFPFIMQVLCLFPLYLFLKNALGEAHSNYCWAGAWVFYLANWVGSLYFSPQAMAFFLLLTLLALLTSVSSLRIKSSFRNYILLGMIVLIFAALAITHLLTALSALCILGVFSLVKRSKSMVMVTGISGLLIMLWGLTGAGIWVNILLSRQEYITTSVGVIGSREIFEHMRGSASHAAVALSRLPFSAIFALLGFSGAIVAFLVRRKFSTNFPILVMAVAPLMLLPLSVNYAGEFTTRLYLFALAPMAYFTVKLIEIRKRALTVILCLLLAIAPIWHVIAHYGNEAIDYLSPARLAGLYFIHDNINESYLTGSWPVGQIKNVEQYQGVGFEQLYPEGNLLTIRGDIEQDLPHHVSISQQDREFYSFFEGNPEFMEKIETGLGTAVNYYLTYDNADLKLFSNESIDITE